MLRQRAFVTTLTTLTAFALLATACGDDGTSTDDESPLGDPSIAVVDGEALPIERCEANRAAGTISYLTGFDFAATASIVDVLVADHHGYFDELCLDVDIAASFSTANYPLVAGNDAQFSSSGSFSELATFSAVNEADLVALAVEGRVAIDGLMVKPEITSLEGLAGTTIGVKGKLPPSIAAMLAQLGLVEDTDFETLLLDGFNPIAHWEVEGISAVPGWKSNEPGALERAEIPFELYDPADFGIPGSFGLIYTNRQFLDEHPTAAEDFMRAAMRGLADAIADPAAAAAIAVDLINGNGNPNFLSPEGETFRWATDARLIADTTPADSFPGVPDAAALESEIAAYDAVGVYAATGAPMVEGRFDPDLLAGLYAADGSVIWPG
jgi:NitT/TauT family transport system substrate-binding protein